MDQKQRIIEAVLFIENSPVSTERLKKITGLDDEGISAAVQAVKERYRSINSALEIIQLENSWQIITARDLSARLAEFFNQPRKKSLSRATLETLSIIAYNQPATKAEV